MPATVCVNCNGIAWMGADLKESCDDFLHSDPFCVIQLYCHCLLAELIIFSFSILEDLHSSDLIALH